jgi:hypothetical protein
MLIYIHTYLFRKAASEVGKVEAVKADRLPAGVEEQVEDDEPLKDDDLRWNV